jgi:hypothetical protein
MSLFESTNNKSASTMTKFYLALLLLISHLSFSQSDELWGSWEIVSMEASKSLDLNKDSVFHTSLKDELPCFYGQFIFNPQGELFRKVTKIKTCVPDSCKMDYEVIDDELFTSNPINEKRKFKLENGILTILKIDFVTDESSGQRIYFDVSLVKTSDNYKMPGLTFDEKYEVVSEKTSVNNTKIQLYLNDELVDSRIYDACQKLYMRSTFDYNSLNRLKRKISYGTYSNRITREENYNYNKKGVVSETSFRSYDWASDDYEVWKELYKYKGSLEIERKVIDADGSYRKDLTEYKKKKVTQKSTFWFDQQNNLSHKEISKYDSFGNRVFNETTFSNSNRLFRYEKKYNEKNLLILSIETREDTSETKEFNYDFENLKVRIKETFIYKNRNPVVNINTFKLHDDYSINYNAKVENDN